LDELPSAASATASSSTNHSETIAACIDATAKSAAPIAVSLQNAFFFVMTFSL
jgi:hypothetical protein